MQHFNLKSVSILLIFVFLLFQSSFAQTKAKYEIVDDREILKTIVPQSFYFAGLSGGTQMRNSAVGKFSEKRLIVAGLVDVSGYSTEISGVYEGFFITDSPVKYGDKEIEIGAYGIGFAQNGKANLFDLSGKQILSTVMTKDKEMRRPRPLMMVSEENGIRLYKGRDYVLISPR
jgi:hypothetical protein